MKSFLPAAVALASLLASGNQHSYGRGFGGYHGGYHGGYGAIAAGGGAAFRGYHGGFGVDGMYEGALDGPRGFSGYGTNWSGYRGGYGIGTATGYRGGYGLGYSGSGGLPGFDNHTRPGPWSRGVAGWRGELGTGGGYLNLGYGASSLPPPSEFRASRYSLLPRLPAYMYGPAGELGGAGRAPRARMNYGLPTDLSLHGLNSFEHEHGYLGDARGLTPFNPEAADAAAQPERASQRFEEASRSVEGLGTRDRGAAAVRREAVTHYWPAAELRNRGNIIRGDVIAAGVFEPSWYDDYASAWIATNMASDLWTPAPWTTIDNWFGENWPAVAYNYGDEITYENDYVDLYGVPIASAAEYSQSAAAIAAQGSENPPKNVSWLPLGVFAAVRMNEPKTNMLMQLAIDKAGVVRGNYFNTGDKNAQQIEGAVDKKTQRIAWIVNDRPNIVFDTGLYNLTNEEATVLVHFGKDTTEQWTLVRLQKPAGQQSTR